MSDNGFIGLTIIVLVGFGALIVTVYGTDTVSTKLCVAQGNQFTNSWGLQSVNVNCDGQAATANAGSLPSGCSARAGDKLDIQFMRWFGSKAVGDFNC